jgi:hypothetical protein
MTRREPEPRLLTQAQAASYCGVCVEVFRNACPVRPIKMLDRIPRYDRFDLDRWLDSLSTFRPLNEGADWEKIWNDDGDSGARKGH